jgi:hypothetical protein
METLTRMETWSSILRNCFGQRISYFMFGINEHVLYDLYLNKLRLIKL